MSNEEYEQYIARVKENYNPHVKVWNCSDKTIRVSLWEHSESDMNARRNNGEQCTIYQAALVPVTETVVQIGPNQESSQLILPGEPQWGGDYPLRDTVLGYRELNVLICCVGSVGLTAL